MGQGIREILTFAVAWPISSVSMLVFGVDLITKGLPTVTREGIP